MATLGNLVVQIGAATKDLDEGLNKAAKKLEKWGKGLQRDARDLTEVLTIPIAGFAAAAIASSEKATAAFKGFADRTKTTFGKFGDEIAKSVNLEGLLEGVSDKFEQLFNWFDKLDESTKKTIIQIAAFVAAVGPALLIIGKLAEAISAAIAVLSGPAGLVLAFAAATAAIGGLISKEAAAEGFFVTLIKSAKELGGLVYDIFNPEEIAAENLKKKMEGFLPAQPVRGERDPFGPEEVAAAKDRVFGAVQGPTSITGAQLEKAKILNTLNDQLAKSATLEEVLGDLYDENAAKTQAHGAALEDLALVGFGSLDESVQHSAEVIETLNPPFDEFFANVNGGFASLKVQAADLVNSISAGFGQAFAQSLVYGQSLRDGLANVFQDIAARQIAMVTEILFQIIAASISAIVFKNIEAYSAIPFVGLALGVAAAGAAIAAARALSSKHGGHGAAKGGIFETPTITSIAERGPEIVLNQRNVEDFMGSAFGGGGRSQQIGVYLDGRSIMNYVVRGMPDMLRLHGAA